MIKYVLRFLFRHGERVGYLSNIRDARVGERTLNAEIHGENCAYGYIGFCDCLGEIRSLTLADHIPWPDDNLDDQLLRQKFIEKSVYSLGARPVNFSMADDGLYGDIELFFEYVESGIARKDYDRLITHNTTEFYARCDVNSAQFRFPVIRANQILQQPRVSSPESPADS